MHQTLAPPRSPGRPPRRRISRATTLVVAVLALGLAACQPHWPVSLAHQNDADAAAAWLVADFQANGSSYNGGALADSIFGLAATDASMEAAEPVLDRLAVVAPAYVSPGGNVNPGATAKVILAVQAMRGNPTSFAGLDLEANLRSTLAESGRFGTSTAFNQSLAVLALARTSGKVPASAATWLASQQCPSGAFSWGNCSFADADHTSLAGTALAAAGGHGAAVNAAASWLLDTQNPDGGWGSPSNANSTGLASQLLRATGHHTEAAAAGEFVTTLQQASGALWFTATTASSPLLATTQGVFAWGAGPYHQLAFPQVQGVPCPDENGVTVIIDFSRFDNTIKITCAYGPQESGWAALEDAGFTLGSVPGFEGQAICTIDDLPADGFPTCWWEGFWSYWHDETGSGEWEFSNWGAANRTPPPGSVEGWRYEPDLYNHWAAAPRVSPQAKVSCAAPVAPVVDIIDDGEVLTFTTRDGSVPFVGTLDGNVPFEWDLLDTASYSQTSTLSLSGLSGLTRVIAFSADGSCFWRGIFNVVYDVREDYTPPGEMELRGPVEDDFVVVGSGEISS